MDSYPSNERAHQILHIQQKAVQSIKITSEILAAVNKIIETQKSNGLVITSGMGKAGIIAQKMSATLASIGIPSFYLHPAESLHGDIGRIRPIDLLVIFSHSGTTLEICQMLASYTELYQTPPYTICITGNPQPKFQSEICVVYGPIQESCVVPRVPSTSTTVMLIIADIIAITAAESLGLSDAWFKARHPGGEIGQSYQTKSK